MNEARLYRLVGAANEAKDALKSATVTRKKIEAQLPGSFAFALTVINEGKCRARHERILQVLGKAFLRYGN